MNMDQIEDLARQACYEGIIEIECPVCGAIIISEPDAEDLYCLECEKVTGKNPLTEMGFI